MIACKLLQLWLHRRLISKIGESEIKESLLSWSWFIRQASCTKRPILLAFIRQRWICTRCICPRDPKWSLDPFFDSWEMNPYPLSRTQFDPLCCGFLSILYWHNAPSDKFCNNIFMPLTFRAFLVARKIVWRTSFWWELRSYCVWFGGGLWKGKWSRKKSRIYPFPPKNSLRVKMSFLSPFPRKTHGLHFFH